ncbi:MULTISPECIES: alpha/beta hydrolase [unclassified Halomonas]|uniref:alpha/beta hydrolase n=1 Tax=unclassified Halomonas TaxID=2609666 RepID=UPI001CF45BD8|nr:MULTISPECIES: alpha/beta hydrolase [unclassified Halomonas]UZH08293.1 alpha/beta hydrolase [Halomonas sp. BDJS001]
MQDQSVMDFRKFKILVVAADPEVQGADALDLEVDDIRAAFRPEALGRLSIKPVSTLDPDTLAAEIRKFAPDVVHFTSRGTPGGFIRLSDRRVIIRSIVGTTLLHILRASDDISCVFMSGCRIFRNERVLAENIPLLAIAAPADAAWDISAIATNIFYQALGEQGELEQAVRHLVDGWPAWVEEETVVRGYVCGQRVGLPRHGFAGPTEFDDLAFMSSLDFGDDQVVNRSVAIYDGNTTEPIDVLYNAEPAATPKARPQRDAGLYTVWFGTNRQLADDADFSKGFTGMRGSRLIKGTCEVVIPKHHKLGSVEGEHWWQRLPMIRNNYRLRVDAIRVLEDAVYWAKLREALEIGSVGEKRLLLFIHGYNTTFEEAAIRAAQLGADLGIGGATAFFSWPSKGSFHGYSADEASVEASEGALVDYVRALTHEAGADSIHVIAHSMGNRGVLRALEKLLVDLGRETGAPFKQFVLAAPDIDVDLFKQLAKTYAKVAERTTLYVSSRDKAVMASSFLHNYPRVGLCPPVTIVDGVDTVEVSKIDLSFLGHGYVAQAREVLSDMHELIMRGVPPDERFSLQRVIIDVGTYWRIRE